VPEQEAILSPPTKNKNTLSYIDENVPENDKIFNMNKKENIKIAIKSP